MTDHIPDTKKKVEPMTPMNLINCATCGKPMPVGMGNACADCQRLAFAPSDYDRAALEAGMRGVLQLTRLPGDYPTYTVINRAGFIEDGFPRYPKHTWIEVANALGLRAEFVTEDDHDTD